MTASTPRQSQPADSRLAATLWTTARHRLEAAALENAVQEARWMAQLAIRDAGADGAAARLEEMLAARCSGMPFQYAVGSVEFYSVELEVGPGVLIPRPETELLVEEALQCLAGRPAGTAVLDLCTGSGAIPMAMAAEAPQFDYTAIDLSPEALRWARHNADRLRPPRLRLLQGDLFEPLTADDQGRFALVTANPPYVSPGEYAALPPEIKDYEPRLALEADDEGMAVAKRILDQAIGYLLPDGRLLMEIGETQGPRLLQYATAHGYRAQIRQDLAGRDRFIDAIPA